MRCPLLLSLLLLLACSRDPSSTDAEEEGVVAEDENSVDESGGWLRLDASEGTDDELRWDY